MQPDHAHDALADLGDQQPVVLIGGVEARLPHRRGRERGLERAPDGARLVHDLGHQPHVRGFGRANAYVGRFGDRRVHLCLLGSGTDGPEKSPVRIPAGLVFGLCSGFVC